MEKHVELAAFNNDGLRNRRDKDSISEVKGTDFDRDRYELARVGKEQVLKVCHLVFQTGSRLMSTASLWPGFHDRSFLWFDVHMGKPPCVSQAPNLARLL